MPMSAVASAGRVVDAVADHGDDLALAPAGPGCTLRLVAGQHLGDDRVDAELARDGVGGALVVAGEHDRPRRLRACSAATASFASGLSVSATAMMPASAPSTADQHRGLALGLEAATSLLRPRPCRCLRARRGAGCRGARRGRPTVAPDAVARRSPRSWSTAGSSSSRCVAARTIASPSGCSRARFDRGREAQHVRPRRRSAERDDVGDVRLAAGQRAGLVEDDGGRASAPAPGPRRRGSGCPPPRPCRRRP